MPTIRLTTSIEAPVERCFDLSLNVDLHRHSVAHTRERPVAGVTRGTMKLGDSVTWEATGLSTLEGTISLTREDHTAPSRPDFSGVTGHVTWLYKPTGKTTFKTSIVRDTGTETSFLSLTSVGLEGLRFDNNRLNWTVLAQADWEATSKILVTPGVRYIRNDAGPGVRPERLHRRRRQPAVGRAPQHRPRQRVLARLLRRRGRE